MVTNNLPKIQYAGEEVLDSIHLTIFTQARGRIIDGRVHVTDIWNNALKPYGELVEGTVVVLPEDQRGQNARFVPLDEKLTPLLLPGFSDSSIITRTLRYLNAYRLINRIVGKANFVLVMHIASFGFIAGTAAARMGKPLLIDMGGTLRPPRGVKVKRPWPSTLARLYYHWAEKRMAKAARLVIAVSPYLHETFPPTNAAKIVAPRPNISAEQIYHRDDACSHTETRLFIASRMIKSKGIHQAIHAVRIMVDEGKPIFLDIAGDGDYLQDLKQLTHELQLDNNVEFLGGLPADEKLWGFFRRADIAILPSLGHYEGTPRQIIEAWAAGAPVIATAAGGIPTMLTHEEDGLLIPQGDQAAIRDAIERLRHDSTLVKKLTLNGYERVEETMRTSRRDRIGKALADWLPGLVDRNN